MFRWMIFCLHLVTIIHYCRIIELQVSHCHRKFEIVNAESFGAVFPVNRLVASLYYGDSITDFNHDYLWFELFIWEQVLKIIVFQTFHQN